MRLLVCTITFKESISINSIVKNSFLTKMILNKIKLFNQHLYIHGQKF